MARKKIVFIIVEGPSDEEALGVILNRIYSSNVVYVHIMHFDITTERGVTGSTILSRVGDIIRQYAASNHYNKADFKEIIHIIDMDGAYIPNENVIEDQEAGRLMYSTTGIRASDKQKIEQRNQQKRSNTNVLCTPKEIWDTPYKAFYMSCNLDHVLYNKLNSSDEEKEIDSFNFAKKYKDKVHDFTNFISCSCFSVMIGYQESWDYIKQGLHSLERHTNLGLCFKEDRSKGGCKVAPQR